VKQDEDARVGLAAALPKAMRMAVLAHRKAIRVTIDQAPARRALERVLDRRQSGPA
jgi:hypothetical protein